VTEPTQGGASGSGDLIRVLLVDEQALFRRGLRATLESEPDLRIVGEARCDSEVVHTASTLVPDVVLTDIRMVRHDAWQRSRPPCPRCGSWS
jgi:DNA-binding NarL/FixJ family response regulator